MADVSDSVREILEEYKTLFGEGHIKFSDDLAIAQEELKKLEESRDRKQSKSNSNRNQLTSQHKLEEYNKFVEQKRSKDNKSYNDLMLLDEGQTSESKERKKSKLEILAEERDLKRRRQSYKGAKTHTGKKSYTEVIREVIESQSELLQSIMKSEEETKHAAGHEHSEKS